MFHHTRVQFILIVLVTLTAISALWTHRIQPGIDLGGGAELRYKVLFKPGFSGDRKQATEAATEVVRRRVENDLLKEPKVSAAGDDEIVLQLAGVDSERLQDVKRRIVTMGKLELYAAASQELQERHARDGIVPMGFKTVTDRRGRVLLVERDPVIEGRQVIHAEPSRVMGADGAEWVTLFELDAEGAKRFDEAAAKLYARQPRGRIVIVLDDVVQSAPVVQAPAFHGRGQISGGRE